MYTYNFDTTKAHTISITQRLKLYFSDGSTRWEWVEVLGSITSARYEQSICGDGPSIGSVCPASFTATVTKEKGGAYPWLNQPIRVKLTFPDGTISLGSFRITSIEDSDDSFTFTAYDALYWATGGSYEPTVGDDPTAADVLADIAQQLNIEVENGTLGGANIPVSGSLTGYTAREMLGYMASLVGKNVLLTRDSRLKLVWFKTGSTIEDYYESGYTKAGSYLLTIIRCVVSTGDDGETTTLTAGGGTGHGIELENPYMTQERLDAIWSDIGGLSGTLGEVSIPYGLEHEAGDIVSGGNGKINDLLVTKVAFDLDGGVKTTLTAAGQSMTETGAAFQGPIGKSITSIKADLAKFQRVVADVAEFKRLTVRDENGVTKIDGKNIKTGSVEAEAIRAGTMEGVNLTGKKVQISSVDGDEVILVQIDGDGIMMMQYAASGSGAASRFVAINGVISSFDGDLLAERFLNNVTGQTSGKSAYIPIPVFQAGEASVQGVANMNVRKRISFQAEFNTAPLVFVTPISANAEQCRVSVTAISSAGFDLVLNRSNNANTNINWMAVSTT